MIRTKIKTIHEEESNDKQINIGILYNYGIDNDYNITHLFNYKDGVYVFFNTITDLFDYMLYAEKNMYRAYMKEDVFDELYDSEIEGYFVDKLEWIK
jgi:hypothetical protein